MTHSRGYQASMQLFSRMYGNVPYFTDIFDEETFYIFALLVVVASFLIAFLLSRFVHIKETDW